MEIMTYSCGIHGCSCVTRRHRAFATEQKWKRGTAGACVYVREVPCFQKCHTLSGTSARWHTVPHLAHLQQDQRLPQEFSYYLLETPMR